MTLNEAANRPFANPSASMAPRLAPGWLAALGAGAGIGALMASSCCVIPLGLAALGAGASVFSRLEWLVTWRVPLLVVSAAAIIGAWAIFWRRGPSPTCERASPCAKSDRTRGRFLVLLGATLILLLAASWVEIEPALLKTGWLG